jgi:hypothetical protein
MRKAFKEKSHPDSLVSELLRIFVTIRCQKNRNWLFYTSSGHCYLVPREVEQS